jgi:hypothetical protein
MKYTIKLLTMLALVLASFSDHSTASALEMFKFRGLGANATFSTVDGCVQTNVDVFTAEAFIQVFPGNVDPFSSVNIFIFQYDLCEDIQLLAAEGVADLAEPDLQISKKLNLATLNTTVNVLDSLTGNTFDVDVNLTWTGIGPTTRERLNFHFRDQTCITHTRFKATVRAAEVMGSVSDGTTNLTPELSLGANLTSSNGSEMAIHCN